MAVGAFNPETGALLWKGGDVQYSPASPVLITVDGQQQLIIFGGDRIAGLDPAGGRTFWSHPHRTDWGLNISNPVWSSSDHLLLFSSAYGTGSRMKLALTRRLVAAALSGELEGAATEPDPVFGLAIPKAVDGVPGSVLRPWESWPDRAAYDAAAAKLAGMFAENFKQYADGVSEEIRAAGPRV